MIVSNEHKVLSPKPDISEKETYEQSVLDRIGKYSASYIIDVKGNKKYADNYSIENDVDYQKFLFFFRCINFNKEICEMILHPTASAIRNEILNYSLTELFIKYANNK